MKSGCYTPPSSQQPNHRNIHIERNFQRTHSHPFFWNEGLWSNYIKFLKNSFNKLLNVSKNGHSTTSLGNFFQCSTTFYSVLIVTQTFPPSSLFPSPPLCKSRESVSIFVCSNQMQAKKPYYFKDEQTEFPCPLLTSASSFQSLSSMEIPKWNTAVQIWPHNCQIEWKNHYLGPGGCILGSAVRYVTGLLRCKAALLIHVQHIVCQDPKLHFSQWASYLVS